MEILGFGLGIGLRPSAIVTPRGGSDRPTATCSASTVRITVTAFVALSLFSFFYFIPVGRVSAAGIFYKGALR